MQYNNKIMGQLIGMLRTEKGLSQEVLSGLAGIGRSHLGKIENGVKNPTLGTLWKIAAALGMKLSQLIALAEDKFLCSPAAKKASLPTPFYKF